MLLCTSWDKIKIKYLHSNSDRSMNRSDDDDDDDGGDHRLRVMTETDGRDSKGGRVFLLSAAYKCNYSNYSS